MEGNPGVGSYMALKRGHNTEKDHRSPQFPCSACLKDPSLHMLAIGFHIVAQHFNYLCRFLQKSQ